MKFPIKDFLSKCDQIRSKLRIWSHLLKKSLIGIYIFCAVKVFHEDIKGSQNIYNEIMAGQYGTILTYRVFLYL